MTAVGIQAKFTARTAPNTLEGGLQVQYESYRCLLGTISRQMSRCACEKTEKLQGCRYILAMLTTCSFPAYIAETGRCDGPKRGERTMLVLSRRIGEEIVIADEICVRIVAVNGQRVRLGITAPRSVPVARRELLTRSPGGARPEANGRPGTC